MSPSYCRPSCSEGNLQGHEGYDSGKSCQGRVERTLSATELVMGSDHSELRLMLTLPWGTRARKRSTAAACASSTLCVTTQGSLLESPSVHIVLSEHRPANKK